MSSLSGLWNKLRDKAYRKGYAESYVSMLVPFQIRALRKAREWTLTDLAERSSVSQEQLECLEEAGYDPQNLDTLYKIAGAFDVGVSVEFVPFSELVSREETFQPDTFNVVSFDEDALGSTRTVTAPQEMDILEFSTPTGLDERFRRTSDVVLVAITASPASERFSFDAATIKSDEVLPELPRTDWRLSDYLAQKRTSRYSFGQGGETWLPRRT